MWQSTANLFRHIRKPLRSCIRSYAVANKRSGDMLSKALKAALVGECEMTQALMSEWHGKRPAEYLAHKRSAIRAALNDVAPPSKAAILV